MQVWFQDVPGLKHKIGFLFWMLASVLKEFYNNFKSTHVLFLSYEYQTKFQNLGLPMNWVLENLYFPIYVYF